MRIGQRLALRFMIVSALITGAILVFVYVLTRGFVHTDFLQRLEQQSSLEVLHFASPEVKDVMSAEAFSLVNPSTSIYSDDGKLVYHQGDYRIPDSWIEFLRQNDIFNAERGEYSTAGRRHTVNGVRYIVFVSDKDLPGEREMTFLFRGLIAGWLGGLVLSYLAGLYFASNALAPVKRVVKEVTQIDEESLAYRLHTGQSATPDEIDELILTFNALLARIEKAFITQKRFVQNASHELKTPLTAIMAEAELALNRERDVEEYKRVIQLILHETERLNSITQGLLTLARLESTVTSIETEPTSFPRLWEQVTNSFRLYHPKRELVVDKVVPAVDIEANANLLQTALLNVLDNACKYSTSPVSVGFTNTNNVLGIIVKDKGIGIPSIDLQRIRTPLFRASNVRRIPGAGIGLSLVHRIVALHGGTLEIESEEGVGTTVTLKVPSA